MGLMQNTECKNEEFLSVKSVKSAVQFLRLRLAALGLSVMKLAFFLPSAFSI